MKMWQRPYLIFFSMGKKTDIFLDRLSLLKLLFMIKIIAPYTKEAIWLVAS